METILNEELPSSLELEDYLQNGVLLCKLAMKLLPDEPMWKKVYDLDQSKFKVWCKYVMCARPPMTVFSVRFIMYKFGISGWSVDTMSVHE